jgi:hypothetical protein
MLTNSDSGKDGIELIISVRMPITYGGKIAGKMMMTFCIFSRKTFEILVS